MIPKENLYKEEKLKFKGIYCRWSDVLNDILIHLPLNFTQSMEIHQSLKAIGEENVVFPLDFLNQSNLLPKDEKGCRIYDWKVLSTPQIRNAMRLAGHIQRVVIQKCPPITNMCFMEGNEPPLVMAEVEKYDKFLNVTYLVNDEFLQEWCNPDYEDTNIAKKQVKDCSVVELLFATRKKLEGKKNVL